MKLRDPRIQNSEARRVQVGWAALVAASLLVSGAVASMGSGESRSTESTRAPAAAATRMIGAGVDSYSALVEQVAPSVVTIRAERRGRTPQQFPYTDDPFFRRFFGERQQFRQPSAPTQSALGSGVIARADGYIVTNHHVIDGAEDITVELADRRTVKAKLVGSDAPSDLAVLQIEAGNLQPLSLGDSAAVNVGDVVLALGNPLGVGQTVTMGIISAAKGRATGVGDGSFEDFLQTDAPINSGNSGGALVNTRGELVGINSQIVSPSGGNIGIGFAIPAAMVRNVMQQLIEHGSVRRAQLGVTAQTIDSRLARSLGLKEVRGAIVGDIAPGSPADRAGLKRGDVVLSVGGHPVVDSNALRNRIASSQPGSEVALTIVRDGREQTIKATLGELESSGRGTAVAAQPGDEGSFGLSVEPLTADRARRLGVSAEKGLAVVDVVAGSHAAEAGLQAGDVIASVDGRAVTTVKELRSVLRGASDRPALVLVHRKGQTLFLTLER